MSFATTASVLASVTLSVKTDPTLPAPNMLPENFRNFTTNIVFSTEKKSVCRSVRKLVEPGRTYILACDIKSSQVVPSSGYGSAGIGCNLTYWSEDWKQAVSMSARGDGNGVWRKVVSKKVTIPDWICHGQLHVGLSYADGSGEVQNIGLFEADRELVIEAKSDCGIAQVKVVDDGLATVFDSGVLHGAPTTWEGRVMADPARNYAVYAIDRDGDIAIWRSEKTNE